MSRPALEVADIFRDHGAAWRKANAGHVSLGQMKVMSAIEHCRTAALGGHVARCENDKCAHMVIVYNSCRNRHCPKCQGAAAKAWLAEREAELLPVGYFHVVFTLPGPIADIAYQNKAVIYHLLFKASAETVLTITDLHVKDDRNLTAVDGFSLEVRAGEIVGVAGVEGNGQRELVEALAGMRRVVSGSMTLGDLDLTKVMGGRVEVAYDGPGAIDIARRFRPEVVFLDIGLPGMSGYEVAEHLRSGPETERALLIALTGWGQDEDRRRSKAAGFDFHLVKPVDLDAMQDLLLRAE